MTQMGLLWWPKQTSATNCGGKGGSPTSTPAITTTPTATSGRQNGRCCIMRLVKKLMKKQRWMLLCAATVNNKKPNTFHYRYDPWSYALNFDTSGFGGMLDDDKYHHSLAFSSRFAATPQNAPPRLLSVDSSR